MSVKVLVYVGRSSVSMCVCVVQVLVYVRRPSVSMCVCCSSVSVCRSFKC